MFLPQTSRGGVIGAPDLLLFPFVKTISRAFSYKAALLRCGGLQEKRKDQKEQTRKKEKQRKQRKIERNKKERKKERKKEKRIKQRNHNYGIKEHDISYLDTKNEISLKMFIVFISFRRQFGAPEVFFPWAPACVWNCMAPLLSCWLTFIFFFLVPSFLHFFLSFPFFSSFFFLSFSFLSLSVSFPFLFSFFLALLI